VLISRLDLDKWIYDPPSESEDEFKSSDLTFMLGSGGGATGGNDQFNSSSHTGHTKKGKKKKGKKGMGEEESEDEEEMERVRRAS
jgi:hypothetical protein